MSEQEKADEEQQSKSSIYFLISERESGQWSWAIIGERGKVLAVSGSRRERQTECEHEIALVREGARFAQIRTRRRPKEQVGASG